MFEKNRKTKRIEMVVDIGEEKRGGMISGNIEGAIFT